MQFPMRRILAYPGCPAWGTWSLARHLADLTNREHLYSLRRAAIFDAASAARRILDLAAGDGYDIFAFLGERPRPGRELQWAWAVPSASTTVPRDQKRTALREEDSLARFAYDVPGLRDASGRLMFSEDCRTLVAEINAWLVEMECDAMVPYQKWAGPDGAWAFALPIGGEWCPCKLRTSEGRVEISLPPDLAQRLEGLIDDQDRRGGFRLVYEWSPGRTAMAFVGKLRAEMDRAFDLLAKNRHVGVS